jgi:DHA1 family bicyclomycin/chloramphenicol resistance-like MFS transporter
MKTAYNHVTLIVLLAALTSVTPLSIDTYLPSMPAIAQSLGVGIEKIEATISIFLLFFALGQMVGGIFSDRMGRRKTALLGLSIFSFANYGLFFTTSLEELYILRAIQAFAGGLAIVNSSAIVRDLFNGTEAAKVFSTIASITMIAPMIAPAIGSVIISFYPWNTVFLFLAIYSSAVTIALFAKLPETGTRSTSKILEAYKRILTHKEAISYILALTFSFSGMFIFIEKSSFIYMEYFKADHRLFPFLFGANVLVMIGMTRLNIKLVQKFQPRSILKTGITIQFFAGLTLLGISIYPNIVAVFIVMTLYVGILGLIFGNGMALALDFFKHDSGVANSVIGVTEFTIAGVIGYIASSFHTGELTPVFLMMSSTPLMAILALGLKPKQLS